MRAALLCGSSYWTPPAASLESLVQFRGAIWPKLGLSLPWGPRPNSPDNIAVVDSLEIYDSATQARIIDVYIGHGYTDVPMGPCVDPGYHGQLPACDFRGNFDVYLDIAERWERAGVRVNHFLRPDRDVVGLGWTVDDLDRELTPLFSTPRAQSLLRKVTLGWEPGPRYFYNNAWWVDMCQWMARVFPKALRSIHMVNDCDAPAGQDDDLKGITNADAWANVAPYLHCWLVQNAGYTASGNPIPSAQFVRDFTSQFNPHVPSSLTNRFANGYAGWPTFSAWGDRGIVPIAAEYCSFSLYWQNWPAEESIALGHAAMEAGALGFFDGGSL